MQAPSLGGVQVPSGDGSTVVRLRHGASLNDFADKIDANPASLVTVLFHLGEMATATQSLDEDTFATLAAELGYIIEMVSAEEEDRELLGSFDIDLDAELADEDDDQLLPRPPVVTVMGHVDHGKTKLLDAVRQTDVVAGEAGGITQHIGAYQVRTVHEGVDRAITFIDTPGHEAFTAMRARGAQVTDIAILVVAADDGVMPQTIEALNHAQAAGVPIVVAVNKIDKEGANPAKVRQQLTEYNLVAEEYGGDTMFVDVSAKQKTGIDQLLPRPPVVTVMGHVDHGNTKLLDAVRQTDVVAGEAGCITQHIGAYQVRTVHEGIDRAITFIDTPGHEAFTAMRARGAQVTDIAILVVAADDGVMPQTIEALNHAQAAGVPIVVAVNKIDKEGANPAKVRQQLTEYNLVAEEYGGDTMFVDVSAKQKTGIDQLLEAVLLTADASLDLRANPDKDARGVAIEANLDKGRGAMATVLVQSGTLHVGDAIVAGTAHGRVRAMFDEHGGTLDEARPARPVVVLGLTSVPRAGDTFLVAPDDRTARQIAEKREAAERAAQLAKRRKRISLEDFTQALQLGKVETLNLVLKGDVSGSVEALEDALLKIDVGEEVELRVIHRGVGAITQNDVNLATVDNAIIIGFNVKFAERVEELTEREGVDVRFYSVIYQAIDDVEAALKGMLKPEYEEVQLGTAEVREVFRSSRFGNIAGSLVRSGVIRRNARARVLRGGKVVGEGLTIDSLKRFKDDATEVRDGYECGIGLGSFNDIQVDDVIETYEMREKPRS